MTGTVTYRFTPAGTGTDLIESDCELGAGLLGHDADRRFLESAMERQMRDAAENFKALAEAEVRVLA